MRPLLQNFLQGQLSSIEVSEALQPSNTLIDVRTSEEHFQGAIPGSRNHPLFDGLERSLIGKLYRQVGREAAVERGTSIVAPQLEKFLNTLRPFQSRLLTVYCARGGMRSKSVTRFLSSEGFRVQQLEGGYKAYRRHVLDFLKDFRPPLIVLHGRTGVGKTLLIRSLPGSIDLENLAQHRSSIFGAVHLQPRNQKNFEGIFYSKTSSKPRKEFIFVEGESRKVGKVFIPEAFADAMKKGKKILQGLLDQGKLEPRYIFSLFEMYLDTNQNKAAGIIGDKMITDFPEDWRGYYSRALVYMNESNFESAISILDPVSKTFSNIFSIKFNIFYFFCIFKYRY